MTSGPQTFWDLVDDMDGQIEKVINDIVDKVNAALTTSEYNKLALQVQNDKQDPKDVAAAFLKDKGLS